MFVAGSTWLQYRESRKSRNLTDWGGMRSEFAYWAEQPDAVAALAELRRTPESWPVGFFEFVAAEVEQLRLHRAKMNSINARNHIGMTEHYAPSNRRQS